MRPATLSIATLLALSGSALAQPVLVITPAAEDIDSTGTKTVGRVVEWTSTPSGPDFAYAPYVWQRGVGFTRVPGTYATPTLVRASSDLSQFVSDLENTSNWGDLNCFNGYCFGSMTGCTPGDPRPPQDPCWVPNITHHYSAANGWVNAGSLERFLDSGTGRYFGGTRCDGTVNSPYDISGDGRYIVGGAWWAPLTTSTGGPGFGLCGHFDAFRYDSVTGTFAALPSNSGSTTTRADRVNYDGTVITGYDLGPIPDGSGGFYDARRMCVWTNGTQSIIDGISGNSSIWPVNSPGTVIAGGPASAFSQATFGVSGIKLVRWVRQPDNSWMPQNLGRPVDRFEGVSIDILVALYPSAISDDGNTIVGTAQYNALGPTGTSRVFIWNPSINAGVPVDLGDYLQTIAPTSPILADGFLLSFCNGVSADSNALLLSIFDSRNTCTNGGNSHVSFTSGVLYLNGAGIACDPPRIVSQPFDWTATQNLVGLGVAMNVAASGTFPLTYQWQREDPQNPGQWLNLDDDCSNHYIPGEGWSGFDPFFNYEGVHTNQLRIGMDEFGVCDRRGQYRVVISNSCGSVTSDPATMDVAPPLFRSQPQDASMCATGGVSSESAVFGVTDENFQELVRRWQVESPESSGQWVDIFGPTFGEGSTGLTFTVADEFSRNLTVSNVTLGTHGPSIKIRHQVESYACGVITHSDVATLTVATCCVADVDDGTGTGTPDGGVTIDDLLYYLAIFNQGLVSADVDDGSGTGTLDGGVTIDDLLYYLLRFNAGC
ncbi:MAG: hypothetical protein IPK69_07975 [Phycisphaerales bacterium]|nr:MAG: hypothetical protein IPK69_07975 [Phycisphaerales bacterium]